MSADEMNLKCNLRQRMEEKDMTASQLARKSSVPVQRISDWLGGRSVRNLDQLRRVARVLEVSIDELLFGDHPSFVGDGAATGKEVELFLVQVRRIKKSRET
jgi:transcriptional regulator with XRE-family HTH domain